MSAKNYLQKATATTTKTHVNDQYPTAYGKIKREKRVKRANHNNNKNVKHEVSQQQFKWIRLAEPTHSHSTSRSYDTHITQQYANSPPIHSLSLALCIAGWLIFFLTVVGIKQNANGLAFEWKQNCNCDESSILLAIGVVCANFK